MKKWFLLGLLVFTGELHAVACTGMVEIDKLWPRDDGWVHVIAKGITNMDLNSCGDGGESALLLNYNDPNGPVEGKKRCFQLC